MNDNTPSPLNSNPRRHRSVSALLGAVGAIPMGMFGFNARAAQAHPTDTGHAKTGRRKEKRARVENKGRDWSADIKHMRKKKRVVRKSQAETDAILHAARRMHSNFVAADQQFIQHNPGDQPNLWSRMSPMAVLKFVVANRRKPMQSVAPSVE